MSPVPSFRLSSTGSRAQEGKTAFNRAQFFRAHELWEEVWQALTGGERDVFQGLIQIAAGCHHLQRDRKRPAANLLVKGVAKMNAGLAAWWAEHEAGQADRAAARVGSFGPVSNLALFIDQVTQLAKSLSDDGAQAAKPNWSHLRL